MSPAEVTTSGITFWQRLGRIDRRIIYSVLALVIIVPLVLPLRLMKDVSPRAREVFNAIDHLKGSGKPLLISVDFDPASLPELYPMLVSMIRHAFARDIKVLVVGLWPNGIGLGQQALTTVAQEFNKQDGVDYVFLGYKAGVDAVILGMGENIKAVFPKDGNGRSLDSLPMMASVKKLADIGFIVSLSAGTPGYQDWLLYAQSRYRAKMAAGSTAVQAADAYPYLQTGQLTGLLAGMKGAAEYEFLVNRYGFSSARMTAAPAMDPQSLAHIAIIVLVIIGNIGFLADRRRKKT
ncbi:MAG: hypothetical protein ABIK62_07795 [candidate division WOR-3 bacterium]